MIRIGYVSTRRFEGCKANKTIRLSSLEKRFYQVAESNLLCLLETLKWNAERDILFFRISSHTIPFASHPKNKFQWVEDFKGLLEELGRFIKEKGIRVSMHPGQFVIINSPKERVYENSVKELLYHANLLDAMGLDSNHKVQIHVGGVYGNKEEGIKNFIKNYKNLPDEVKNRLVVEHDDKLYSLEDCLKIHEETGIPVVLDTLHLRCLGEDKDLESAINKVLPTWNGAVPMVDYSDGNVPTGEHAQSINEENFERFLNLVRSISVDIMLEVKDKERSALKAVSIYKNLIRFSR